MVRATIEATVPQAGVQRVPPLGRGLGVSRVPKGESRGAQPHWQAVWRMCLHKPSSFLYCPPFLEGRGPGGWSEPPLRQQSPKPESRECRPLAGVWECPPEAALPSQGESRGVQPAVPPPKPESRGAQPLWQWSGVSRVPKGESRGAQPPWQVVWRMCLHKPSFFFIFPLPSRKGARGMVRTTIEATVPQAGVQRVPPLGRGLGVSPRGSPTIAGGVQRGTAPLAGGMEDVPP